MKDKTALQTLLAPIVEALGYEFWGYIYIPQGRYAVLRIYIDSEQGITVDDCEKVSRQVSAVLDVEDPIIGGYTLEVSSPGVDRPLFTSDQFARYMGHEVNIRLRMALENRKHLRGVIQKVTDTEVAIRANEQEYLIARDNIARANLIGEEGITKKKKGE